MGRGAEKLKRLIGLSLVSSLVLGAPTVSKAEAEKLVPVPFVGCASDGQVGPQEAPDADDAADEVPNVPESMARKLAYYRSAHMAALAPRGWHCFGLYGSNGSILIVTPERHGTKDLIYKVSPLIGPAVQISSSDSGTSGRFEVARIAARLFPKMKDFVQGVIDEKIPFSSDAGNFPYGPYPTDIIRRQTDSDVEFETPANLDGMGTQSRLKKNSYPINGIARMSEDGALMMVVRMPPNLRYLTPMIMGNMSSVEYIGSTP